MGFTKRFVDQKTVKVHLENSDLKTLFSPRVDAFIFMDTISSDVFNLFQQGHDESQIFSTLKKQNQNLFL
jgi:hypothetical protein